MSPKISVIVPVYNGEKFIEKCLNSILNQTYENLEIIVINDGSEDKSPELCNSYAKKDCRVRVVHQKNAGLSSVRNKGLQLAKGGLIGFVDQDDFIHPKMYELLLTNLIDCDADISICDYSKIYDCSYNNYLSKNLDKQNIYTYSRLEALKNLLNKNYLTTVVPWNKIYKKELFKNVRYPVGKTADDEFVIHHIIQSANKIVYTDLVLYYYFHNTNSITNKQFNLSRLDGLTAIKDRIKLFQEQKYDDLLPLSLYIYLHLIIKNYFLVKMHLPYENKVLKKLKLEFNICYKNNIGLISKENRKEFTLFYINANLYLFFIYTWKLVDFTKRITNFRKHTSVLLKNTWFKNF